MTTQNRLSGPTVWLHWVAAILMIFMVASGIIMEDVEIEGLFDLHTSIGVVIVAVIIPRLVWRFIEGWPEPAGDYTRFEHLSGKLVHWLLVIFMVLMPLSGIVMALAGGHGLAILSWELVAVIPDPNNPEEVLVLSPALQELGESLHSLGGDILPIAIGLHVAGALKHHLVDKDETLRRMLGLRAR